MTRIEKNDLIESLSEKFKSSDAIIVCNYRGLTHIELEELRNIARESDVVVQVVKNTLVVKAIERAELEVLELNNTNIYLWSNDQISACKVADKFAKSNEKFEIKTGLIEGKVADLNTINALAKLPGRDELIGMLLSVWTAPARNFVVGLDNLKSKLEEDAA